MTTDQRYSGVEFKALCLVLEGRIAAGIAKFGKRRAEGLDVLRLSEVTADLCRWIFQDGGRCCFEWYFFPHIAK
jgi:hypothetical protein